LWTTPGTDVGSSDAGPTQAMRSSCDKIAALLQTSAPVQSLPIFVSSRTVTLHRPAEDSGGALPSGQPCVLSYRASEQRGPDTSEAPQVALYAAQRLV
jgi:hypothetical protein